jgi:hypothetical protein
MGHMLWEYTLEYIRLLDERRVERFQALQSAEDLQKLRETVRARLAEMWGPFPAERTPLNVVFCKPGRFVISRRVLPPPMPFWMLASGQHCSITAIMNRAQSMTRRVP